MRFFLIITFVLHFDVSSAYATPLEEGYASYEKGNHEEAIQFWKRAADAGSAEAEYSLCAAYYNGDGVKEDVAEAIQWCRKSAAKDNVGALVFLATLYWSGHGVKKNAGEAANWFERAANEGDLYSQARLGAIYSDGVGVKKDVVRAYKWLRLARDANEKYYGWSSVVDEMTTRERTSGEDIDRDLNQLAKVMTPEQISEAETQAGDWETVFKESHPVKRKFSPLLFFFAFLLPALAMSSVPGRQQRFYYGVRMATWAIMSLLLFVPWFLAWSHGENLQNSPDSWIRAFIWTGFVMLLIAYLMKRCSSEALTFFDGLMFAIASFGAYSGVHVIVACPLFIIIIAASLTMSLFYELTGQPEKTAVQYHKFIGFFYKHRHDAER